jgi:hypothetical protein
MDYGRDGQACRQTFIYRITEGLPVIHQRRGSWAPRFDGGHAYEFRRTICV